MAYLIFSTVSNPSCESLCKIAETEEHLNNLNIIKENYVIKIISDSDFNNIKNNTKEILSVDGDNITYKEVMPTATIDSKEDFDNRTQYNIKLITKLLNNSTNSVFKSLYEDYLETLNNLDSTTITFPLNQKYEQYLESQSLFYLHSLQLS